MVSRFAILALLGFLIGCGSPATEAKLPDLKVDPNAQPAVSETAKKVPAQAEEIKKLLDLAEYPGAQIVENNKLASDSFSPDEVRFELVRKSADAPGKVIAYFEDKLSTQATGDGGHKEIFGRTQRGNFVRIHVDGEGTGTKYKLSVISYAK